MNQSLIDNLLHIIPYKTITAADNPEVIALYDWVEKQIQTPQFRCTRIESEGFTSLIIDTSSENPACILSAHIDVVPGSEHVFIPKVEDGKVIGRGAIDMKFALACYIELIKDIPDVLHQKRIRIVLTSDEETGGKNGIGFLANVGLLKSNIVILPDGGTDLSLMKAEKGVIHCTIRKKGIAAHGAYPWRGRNALETLLVLVKAFQDQFPPPDTEYSWTTTVSLTAAHAGKAVNQIPDIAEVSLDIRFTEEYTLSSMKQNVFDAFGDCEIEFLSEGECVFLTSDNPYVALFTDILSKAVKGPVNMIHEHGASDARYISPLGIPVIMTKPLSGGEHTEQEWIDINSLELFYSVLKEFLQKM